MKKIFISRDLAHDSPFSQQLTAEGHEVYGESLLSFTPISIENPPKADWLFFYSQKGVRFFFEQFERMNNNHDMAYKYAGFGPATAKAIKFYTEVDPYFTGTGFAETTANQFRKVAAGEIVCFVQAKNSRKSIQTILEDEITCRILTVYDNQFKEDISLLHFDILVFTSPMNAEAYFSKYEWKETQKVVAIGHTTYSALNEMGVDCYISETPSEEGMLKQVLNLVR